MSRINTMNNNTYPRSNPTSTSSTLHSVLSSQPGVSFNPNKPAFIPSPSGPHGNIAVAHLAQSQAAHAAQLQVQQAQLQAQAQAQAQLHLSLQSLNAKIVQAQQLALINGLSVDEVLRRMGGLCEQEVGLLKLCVVREQEERLKAQAVGLMSQQQQQTAPFPNLQSQRQPQSPARLPLRTTSPPNITLNSPPSAAQEQRTAARLKVEQNLLARRGKEQAAGGAGGWEEAFAKMNVGGQQAQVGSPVARAFSPANSVHSATSEKKVARVNSNVSPQAQNKHSQAVSWRAVGKPQQTSVAPVASPFSIKLNAQNAENAVKSFNGVFGNKVVTPSPSSPTRQNRSGSGSSGSGQSSVEDDVSLISSSGSAGGRRRISGGGESAGSEGNMSRSSFDTGMTTPQSEGGSQAGDNKAAAGYFGSKNLQVHGRDETFPLNLSKVLSRGSNASGVIGQGYPSEGVKGAQGVSVIRQPHGPPGGADELGTKNFASRIRQKAVSDLSVLGRRVAQRSPTTTTY